MKNLEDLNMEKIEAGGAKPKGTAHKPTCHSNEVVMTKESKNGEAIGLFLRRGVYLDSEFPYPPSPQTAQTQVKKVVCQMSNSERVLAIRRMEVLATYMKAAQSVLAQYP